MLLKKEIEDKIKKEYIEDENIVCGCEEISYENYRLFKIEEYKKNKIIK